MNPVFQDAPGKTVLMMGNEAIARGALEAGVDFTSSYPGSPASEIQEVLARASRIFGHHAEWAVNEKVALEACVGVSFAGMRSLSAMKQNGINVASDVLNTMNLAGTKGGIVLIVADDPAAHSSTNEMDSRAHARLAELPLLEPGSAQEAKEMTKYAFELSEKHRLITIVRSVTRISHARGNVTLGELPKRDRKPQVGDHDRFLAHPIMHPMLHNKNEAIRKEFESSPFNRYDGPEDAEVVIMTCGTGAMYSWEAIRAMGLKDRVGVLKLGTTWPLPKDLIMKHLWHAKEVIIIEEVDPFLEDNVKVVAAGGVFDELEVPKIYGKRTGHVAGPRGAGIGEMDVNVVSDILGKVTGKSRAKRTEKFEKASAELSGFGLPGREWAFCAGCPHRASFWVMRTALKLDDRKGFVLGDIGCYSMGVSKTGYNLSRNLSCMGSGIGHANGLGQLKDMNQPIIAIVGDSTFFHSALPGLAHARYNGSRFTYVVLDNTATSMTGFQPHPGTGKNALGEPAPALDIPTVCKGFGIDAAIVDPFDFKEAVAMLYDAVQEDKLKVLIFRHKCQLIEQRELEAPRPRVYIDQQVCVGDSCGCMRLCSRVFGCPALIWDAAAGRAIIDEVVCTRCGVCVNVCPQGAIKLEAN
ncbi:MAG TPA: indolepyruvate ferredoxin oxidoreductase subunit alpha [bacterium]|nr:indolepyruvate ferredoxin oxidoreductase subunit alpha [bacterium]